MIATPVDVFDSRIEKDYRRTIIVTRDALLDDDAWRLHYFAEEAKSRSLAVQRLLHGSHSDVVATGADCNQLRDPDRLPSIFFGGSQRIEREAGTYSMCNEPVAPDLRHLRRGLASDPHKLLSTLPTTLGGVTVLVTVSPRRFFVSPGQLIFNFLWVRAHATVVMTAQGGRVR